MKATRDTSPTAGESADTSPPEFSRDGPPPGFQIPDWQYLTTVGADLDVELTNLKAARDSTRSKLCVIARHLREQLPPGHALDVVAFGSLARLEASDASDFDYLLLAHRLVSPSVVRIYRGVADQAGQVAGGLAPPGRTGVFGQVVSASSLTQHIGLQEDTNVSHTRRMLVLEESLSLYVQGEHAELIKNILSRYIIDYETDSRPARVPRFLLNDALRYWYQMTVDYQAKRWSELPAPEVAPGANTDDDPLKWGLRFLKLVLSRKLAYAGTLASILLVAHDARQSDKPVSVSALHRRFSLTAMDRLAELGIWLREEPVGRDALKVILETADWFAGRLDSREFRSMANTVMEPRAEGNPAEFKEALDRANTLHDALMTLFFDTELMRDASRKYLAF